MNSNRIAKIENTEKNTNEEKDYEIVHGDKKITFNSDTYEKPQFVDFSNIDSTDKVDKLINDMGLNNKNMI